MHYLSIALAGSSTGSLDKFSVFSLFFLIWPSRQLTVNPLVGCKYNPQALSEMIIAQLLGGLGNQMFQYAAGRSLAFRSRQKLLLDLRELTDRSVARSYTPRCFSLDACNITAAVAKDDESDSLRYRDASVLRRCWRAFRGRPRPYGPFCYRERGIRFDSRVLRIRSDAYLIGFWQSYKYFENCENLIRQDFTPRGKLSTASQRYLGQIAATDAVSVHVRRGDYVTNLDANSFHGTCELSYYRTAAQLIANIVQRPHFFVFSDEVDWAKAHMGFIAPVTFVQFPEPVHDFEEIHLMSMCRFNIIANSSFSWWGAWLNNHPNRVVVAPMRWFRDPKIDTSDMIPSDWLRV